MLGTQLVMFGTPSGKEFPSPGFDLERNVSCCCEYQSLFSSWKNIVVLLLYKGCSTITMTGTLQRPVIKATHKRRYYIHIFLSLRACLY